MKTLNDTLVAAFSSAPVPADVMGSEVVGHHTTTGTDIMQPVTKVEAQVASIRIAASRLLKSIDKEGYAEYRKIKYAPRVGSVVVEPFVGTISTIQNGFAVVSDDEGKTEGVELSKIKLAPPIIGARREAYLFVFARLLSIGYNVAG